MTSGLQVLDSGDVIGNVLAHDHEHGVLRDDYVGFAVNFNLMTVGMQVQGFVAFFDLQRQVLDFVGGFPAEYGIAILSHRQRITRSHAYHDSRMYSIMFANARGQIKATPGLVRCFKGLNQDSVTNDHDIL